MISYDDIDCLHSPAPFAENIDYMLDSHIDEFLLFKCWKHNNSHRAHDDISLVIPSTISKRLENVCWRRWYKLIHNLKETSPVTINWYKNQDITWLYGPKYNDANGFDIGVTQLTYSNVSKLDDTSDVESMSCLIESGISSLSLDDMSDVSSDDDDDDVASHRKSSLKKARPSMALKSLAPIHRRHIKKQKAVSFNYIINTREIINGMSFDYNCLDESCL